MISAQIKEKFKIEIYYLLLLSFIITWGLRMFGSHNVTTPPLD